jgi:GNAT superfamily N-acetyltransferase
MAKAKARAKAQARPQARSTPAKRPAKVASKKRPPRASASAPQEGSATLIAIRAVRSLADLALAKRMIQEYADGLGVDLSFQDFAEELAALPGAYVPPKGGLWLALAGVAPAGCVALAPLADDACELKRLYVRPGARGSGIGRALAEAAIAQARKTGYARVRLDTLPQMGPAITLYQALGFEPIAPYRYNPIAGASFWELDLSHA